MYAFAQPHSVRRQLLVSVGWHSPGLRGGTQQIQNSVDTFGRRIWENAKMLSATTAPGTMLLIAVRLFPRRHLTSVKAEHTALWGEGARAGGGCERLLCPSDSQNP